MTISDSLRLNLNLPVRGYVTRTPFSLLGTSENRFTSTVECLVPEKFSIFLFIRLNCPTFTGILLCSLKKKRNTATAKNVKTAKTLTRSKKTITAKHSALYFF